MIYCPNRVDLGTKPAWRLVGCQDFCTAICCKLITSNKTETKLKKVRYSMMKGYYTDNGYMGYINGSYRLFADESDYREYLED